MGEDQVAPPRRAWHAVWRYGWAAPASVLGLMFVVPALLFGARAKHVAGTLEVSGGGLCHVIARQAGFDAITLGHVILGRHHRDLARLRCHEQVHVRQYERFGVLMLLLYPLAGVWALLRGRRAYWDNPFERQARYGEALARRSERNTI